MSRAIYGIALILIGLVYLWKPTIFRRGIWMKTSIAIRTVVGGGAVASPPSKRQPAAGPVAPATRNLWTALILG